MVTEVLEKPSSNQNSSQESLPVLVPSENGQNQLYRIPRPFFRREDLLNPLDGRNGWSTQFLNSLSFTSPEAIVRAWQYGHYELNRLGQLLGERGSSIISPDLLDEIDSDRKSTKAA